jgi:SAM-dependent methyltransferase
MDPAAPFDPLRVRAHRARAREDVLVSRAAEDLAGRLDGVNRSFGFALAQGGARAFAGAVAARPELAARMGLAAAMDSAPGRVAAPFGLAADPERLPFADGAFDLIVSILMLHWANDLPGALIQLRRALKPDGLLLAAFFGGRTLHELREALLTAESETFGGAGPRVAPFADLIDCGHLLQRAGFALPVVDLDAITVRYAHPLALIADLRAMGETSALTERPGRQLTRAALARMIAYYQEHFSEPDGRVRATFEIITLTGWAPHESQQQPLKPGSAKARLADALGVKERSAGEKPGD